MAKKKLEIPDGVTDKASYLKYLKYAKHPLLNEEKMQTCSDGTEINLASFPHIITKKIAHLPVKEQNELLEKKDEYASINNKATALKRKAFGDKMGRAAKGGVLVQRQAELIEYFGRMFTVEEMVKHINEEWGMPIKKQAVEKFRREHAVEIEKKIEMFKSSYSDIRLGVKRSRLEELVWLYGKAKDKYKDTLSREDYKMLLTTLEAIRKEAEGDRLTIDGKVDISYEAEVNMHLRDEVFKTLNLKEIIIARVAARMNVNPVKLIFSLNQSFYSAFSNVLGDFDENEAQSTALTYPSQMNYNFEKIQKYHVQRDKEVEDAVVVEEEKNDKDVEKGKEMKETLAEKIKRKREAMKKTEANINAETDIAGKNKGKGMK